MGSVQLEEPRSIPDGVKKMTGSLLWVQEWLHGVKWGEESRGLSLASDEGIAKKDKFLSVDSIRQWFRQGKWR